MKEELLEKSKEELVDFLMELAPDMRSHQVNRNSWENLPFIPEDCGFKDQKIIRKGLHDVVAYYKDGVSCVKIDGVWIIKKGDDTMSGVDIPNKFIAYHLFKSMGVIFDNTGTTVPDSILMSVDEFLEHKKESLKLESGGK